MYCMFCPQGCQSLSVRMSSHRWASPLMVPKCPPMGVFLGSGFEGRVNRFLLYAAFIFLGFLWRVLQCIEITIQVIFDWFDLLIIGFLTNRLLRNAQVLIKGYLSFFCKNVIYTKQSHCFRTSQQVSKREHKINGGAAMEKELLISRGGDRQVFFYQLCKHNTHQWDTS